MQNATGCSAFLSVAFVFVLGWPGFATAQEKVLKVTSPMSPPAWALLERQVLDASSDACRQGSVCILHFNF